MKMETTAGMLKAALDTVGRAIEKRNSIPILGTVKFDRGSVEGTNLDLSITAKLPTRAASGAMCLPFAPLRALLAHIPQNDVVAISAGADGASIGFGSTRYDLPAMPATDFPEIELGELTAVPVDGEALKKALAFVSPCISTEETRYYLNGVCLDDNLAVATDGHRLGCHPLGFDASAFGKGIIPRESVAALLALPPAKTMGVSASKLRMSVSGNGVTVRAKLIDATYPDWRRVVPAANPDARVASIDRAQLLRLAMRMKAICVQIGTPAILAWDERNLALIATDHAYGITAREIMPVSAMMRGQTSLNLRYLQTVLKQLAAPVVKVVVADQYTPTIWRGDGEAFMICMPMRAGDKEIAAAVAMLAEHRSAESKAA